MINFTINIKLGDKTVDFDVKDDSKICELSVKIDNFAGHWIRSSIDFLAPINHRDVPICLRSIADDLDRVMDLILKSQDFLLAERGELERILAKISPSRVIDRLSYQSRLDSVNAELEKLEKIE